MNRYNEYMYTKVNFGKYRGFFMKDVPNEYVEWAIKNVQDPGIATMFSVEYQRRYKYMRK